MKRSRSPTSGGRSSPRAKQARVSSPTPSRSPKTGSPRGRRSPKGKGKGKAKTGGNKRKAEEEIQLDAPATKMGRHEPMTYTELKWRTIVGGKNFVAEGSELKKADDAGYGAWDAGAVSENELSRLGKESKGVMWTCQVSPNVWCVKPELHASNVSRFDAE